QGVRIALDEGLAQVRGVPLLTVSGATGKGLDALIAAAFDLRDQWSKRVTTAELNRWFEAAIEANPPPAPKGQRIKLRYITQARNRPPTFIAFGSRTDLLPESYRRFLVNGIRRELGLGAVPVRLTFRSSRNPFGDALRKSARASTNRPAPTRGSPTKGRAVSARPARARPSAHGRPSGPRGDTRPR
ncbi:MAG: hypothetical protein ABL874_02940, partial [Sphingopyxis sp.]